MKKRIKCIICVVLSLVLAWSLVPLTQAEAAKSKLDPEVRRAMTLGIVSSSYLKKPNQAATAQDLKDMCTKILQKRGASAAKIRSWKKLTHGSKKTVRTADSILAVYYVSRYLSKNNIPRTNSHMTSKRWIPADWDQALDYIETSNFIKVKSGTFKFYAIENGWHGVEAVDVNNFNFTTATMFAVSQASHYSNQYLFPQAKDRELYINKKLTRADLALQMTRLYDSFEEPAKYVKINKLGDKTVISDKLIAGAKAVPAVGKTGTSDAYIGTYTQNYVQIGVDGSLPIMDDLTWNFRETDFQAMADQGMNYVRIQFACNSLAYPDYSKDRTKVNEAIVEELDDVVRWGLKYGLHVSICFMGYPDDDLDGINCYGDDKNYFTPDLLAGKASYELKAKLLEAFAGRYKNVPAQYLSFELQNENATATDADASKCLSLDEMADQFIMLAEHIWSVTPERGVSLSTDEELLDYNLDYWTKIAKAGINLDYHCYEPRAFVAPGDTRQVSADQMVWPGFVDQNGQTWNMEKVYQTYILPWAELADQCGVGFKLGECGIFVDTAEFAEPPYQRKYVLAWAEDFASVMQKHQLSYVVGKYVGNTGVCAVIKDDLPDKDDQGSYIKNAKYVRKTYTNGNYTTTYYVNQELVKALFGKHS